jgi:hypothetical protein
LSEDGLASCRRGLSVIIGPELGALRAQHIGIADVTGIVILLTISGKEVFNLLDGFYMMSEGEELATLFGVVALAIALKCTIFVGHDYSRKS